MSVPFHKQTDPNKQAGQVVFSPIESPINQQGFVVEQTLNDYIARKDTDKRSTFEEWWNNQLFSRVHFAKFYAEEAWNAALKQGKL